MRGPRACFTSSNSQLLSLILKARQACLDLRKTRHLLFQIISFPSCLISRYECFLSHQLQLESYLLQARRPCLALLPNVCVMCFKVAIPTTFQLCPVAWDFLNRLSSVFGEKWVVSRRMEDICTHFLGFEKGKYSNIFWHVISLQ